MNKNQIKYKVEKIIINDFSKMNLFNPKSQSAVECYQIYNFNNADGSLKSGLGIREYTTHAYNNLDSVQYPLNVDVLNLEYINKVMYFKQYFALNDETLHRLLIHGSDNKLYVFQMFSNMDEPTWVYQLQFDSIPAVLSYKKDGLDSILISAKDKLVVWSTGRTPYEITNVPTITSMCVYNDVLYCTIAGETDTIWYTSNLDPESVGTESDETKYLTLDGTAGGGRKIVMLKENMYVFCDYGIGRLNTYAKSEPTYHQIYASNAQIYPNTICVCGDFVVFAMRGGLYKFNGTSVTKINQVESLLLNSSNDYAVATCLKGCYYLATKINFDNAYIVGCESVSGYKNNALIKLDLSDNSFEIMRGVDVKDMTSLNAGVEEKVLLTFNSQYKYNIGEIYENGELFSHYNLDGYYSTNYIVQDNFKPVTISSVEVDAGENVLVQIVTENKMYRFSVVKAGITKFQTAIRCKKFKVEVESNNPNAVVKSVVVECVRSV